MDDATWLAFLRIFSEAQEEFNLEEDPEARVEDFSPIFVLRVEVKRARSEALPPNPLSTNEEGPEEAG
jgi:hypothetical protein